MRCFGPMLSLKKIVAPLLAIITKLALVNNRLARNF